MVGLTETDEILEKYSLTPSTAAQYIDAIVRMNQIQTADKLGVSRDTVNRYKNAFDRMSPEERSHLIILLTQHNLFDQFRNE